VRRRFNPYVAGAPVFGESLFFGRQELIERILQSLPNNSILLYGERRIGKTSLQHQLKRRLRAMDDPEFEFHPVYVDLQGIPEEQFFSTIADELFAELGHLVPDLGSGSSRVVTDYGYRELVRDIRSVLKGLEARGPKRPRLVLQIDEVDELNDYDPRVNQRLRSLFMKTFAENLVAVVSGVKIKKHWDREGSPWYNFFEEVQVPPLDDEVAQQLVEEPIRGILDLETGVPAAVVRLARRRPYLIQKLCMALVNRVHDEGRRRITMADVEAVGAPMET
jgi:hypothetical protein